jgi:hypothetical protein
MRSFLIAATVALPLGLLGTTASSAAPVSGQAINDAAAVNTMIEDVQFSRRRCRWVTRNVHRWNSSWRPRTVRRCWHRG